MLPLVRIFLINTFVVAPWDSTFTGTLLTRSLPGVTYKLKGTAKKKSKNLLTSTKRKYIITCGGLCHAREQGMLTAQSSKKGTCP